MTTQALFDEMVGSVEGSALQKLLAVERLGIGKFPTPVAPLTLKNGAQIYIKRDDLVDFGRGGIKARKIDFLVRHLLDSGSDALVSVATNVTNLVHDIVPVLDEYHVDYRFFVSDDPPLPIEQRRQLFAGFPSDKVELTNRSRARLVGKTLAAAAKLRANGRRPMLLLPSLGHAASVIGLARGYVEAIEQLRALSGAPPRTLFITAASGVSLAGLLLGEACMRASGSPRVNIVGVCVYSGPVRNYARLLVRWAERLLGCPNLVRVADARLTDWRDVGDFGQFTPQTAALCERVQQDYGLRVDPIYGGKTWGVMETLLSREPELMPCLYWHCGFTPDWQSLKVAP